MLNKAEILHELSVNWHNGMVPRFIIVRGHDVATLSFLSQCLGDRSPASFMTGANLGIQSEQLSLHEAAKSLMTRLVREWSPAEVEDEDERVLEL